MWTPIPYRHLRHRLAQDPVKLLGEEVLLEDLQLSGCPPLPHGFY